MADPCSTNRRQAKLTLLGACVCLVLSAQARALGVSAGTLIENTAIATFNEGATSRSISSNTVTVRVDELLNVTLTSLDPASVTARSGEAVLRYELTNQGNGPEAFRLIANAQIAGNDFDVVINAIAIDRNGNGLYDAGVDEILAAPHSTAPLAPGAVFTVFVLVAVPGEVADNDRTVVELGAEAITGTGNPGTVFETAGVNGGDAIVGATQARALARGSLVFGAYNVTLVKSVVLRDPFGGSSAVSGTIASFTISANVSGTGAVTDLVITDPIPEGTTYVAGSLQLDGLTLSDAEDNDAGQGSGTSGISVELGTVASGTSHAITFDVAID